MLTLSTVINVLSEVARSGDSVGDILEGMGL